ncbi:MAG: hypothetical protein PHC41_10010 [Lachnospiraceae bacterium]|nr:hypothetical protein [Lachnospiraceae bacterium]
MQQAKTERGRRKRKEAGENGNNLTKTVKNGQMITSSPFLTVFVRLFPFSPASFRFRLPLSVFACLFPFSPASFRFRLPLSVFACLFPFSPAAFGQFFTHPDCFHCY